MGPRTFSTYHTDIIPPFAFGSTARKAKSPLFVSFGYTFDVYMKWHFSGLFVPAQAKFAIVRIFTSYLDT